MPNNLADTSKHLEGAVRAFMQIGRQTTGTFNATQAAMYTGLQLEELAEKLMAIADGTSSAKCLHKISMAARVMNELADDFKSGKHVGDIMNGDLTEILDADIDLAWVAIGGALSVAADASGAISEVIRANLDKYPNGQVLKDGNGKVMKPKGWRPPNLLPYL